MVDRRTGPKTSMGVSIGKHTGKYSVIADAHTNFAALVEIYRTKEEARKAAKATGIKGASVYPIQTRFSAGWLVYVQKDNETCDYLLKNGGFINR